MSVLNTSVWKRTTAARSFQLIQQEIAWTVESKGTPRWRRARNTSKDFSASSGHQQWTQRISVVSFCAEKWNSFKEKKRMSQNKPRSLESFPVWSHRNPTECQSVYLHEAESMNQTQWRFHWPTVSKAGCISNRNGFILAVFHWLMWAAITECPVAFSVVAVWQTSGLSNPTIETHLGRSDLFQLMTEAECWDVHQEFK